MYSKSGLFLAKIALINALLVFTLWSVVPVGLIFSEINTDLVEFSEKDVSDKSSEDKDEKNEENFEKGFLTTDYSNFHHSCFFNFGILYYGTNFYEFSLIDSFYSPPEFLCSQQA